MRSLALFALLLSAATPALAENEHAEHQAEKPVKAKKICRAVGEDTGTRLSRTKICKTEAQWKAIDARGGKAGSR